jgi:hypothetical protein
VLVAANPLAVTPALVRTITGTAVTFRAAGGLGSYGWSLAVDGSGATLSGPRYTAGATPGTDVVQVVDTAGQTATATVQVAAPLVVAPVAATVDPGFSRAFTAAGGFPPYTWSLSLNGSGGGVTAEGLYTAGPRGPTADTVTVADAAGFTASAAVTVPPPLVVTSGTGGQLTLDPGASVVLAASGGTGPYVWTLEPGGAGGSVTPEGVFTAGEGCGASVVRVTDANGGWKLLTVNVPCAGGEAEPAPAVGLLHLALTAGALVALGLRRLRAA